VLNPDARLTSTTLSELIAAAERHPTSAVVGPKTLYQDGRPQISFGPDLTLLSEWRQRPLVRRVKAGDAQALDRASAMTAAEKNGRLDFRLLHVAADGARAPGGLFR